MAGLARPLLQPLIYPAGEVPPARVAIVFGARVFPDGQLSAMLRDRVETAVQLYEAGKVQKLLLSGDNRFEDYNEPGQMVAYAVSRGVPPDDIQLDYAGRRTYDTCYRQTCALPISEILAWSPAISATFASIPSNSPGSMKALSALMSAADEIITF